LEDRRNVGKSSCKSGDGTDHRVQSLMFMMMMNELTLYIKNQFVPHRIMSTTVPQPI